MSDKQMQFLPQLHQAITEIDTELTLEQKNNQHSNDRTHFYRQLAQLSLIAFVFFLIFEGVTLSRHIQSLADDMVLMYQQFGEMSDEMHEMTGNVSKMEANVRTIPVMASEMGLIVTSMKQMHQNMTQMRSDVVIMEGDLNQITVGMNEMNSRFSHLNHTVNFIDYNVHAMSKTVP